MIAEFFVAAFKAGIPVGLASFLLVSWVLRRGHLENADSMESLNSEMKRLSKNKRKSSEKGELRLQGTDLVTNKWLTFGGGFYGVVGVLTYVVVELGEIRDFITQFESFSALLRGLTFNAMLGLLFEALKNTLTALAWPVYWMSDIAGEHIWVWFLTAYGGYWLGARLALSRENS